MLIVLLLVLIAVAVVSIVAAFQLPGREWLIAPGILVGGVCVALLIGITSELVSYPAQIVRLAQTRATVAQLGCHASEDVLGAALEENRHLASSRFWMGRWYGRPFFAPGKDTLPLIDIPVCK